jgi:phosphoglycerate-specific signal transduction histidine kinase
MTGRHKYLRSLEVPAMSEAEIAAALRCLDSIPALEEELTRLAGNHRAFARRGELAAKLRALRTGERED